MTFYHEYNNGLRVFIEKIEGLMSVSCGVTVNTGSSNETMSENGISHFIEHVMFKGTKKRSAFEISNYIDQIGAQINAFTSKELTCYYTKSTYEHSLECLEVLSDIFFDSLFNEEELSKEKGVILEEINMSEDTPEDLLFDLLAESYFGKHGLGQTILGPAKNVKGFKREDIINYMEKFYTADNVVISVVGNVDINSIKTCIEELFVNRFNGKKAVKSQNTPLIQPKNLFINKPLEQAHVGLCMPAFSVDDDKSDGLSIANIVLGGGMSSRLFQTIREQLGLCYSVYSYTSLYQGSGVLEVYAGVNTSQRDLAFEKIMQEIKKIKEHGITEQEFLRAKEQIKSSIILGRENTSGQMMLSTKYIFFLKKEYDFKQRLNQIENLKLKDVQEAIDCAFDLTKISTASVGSIPNPIDYKI